MAHFPQLDTAQRWLDATSLIGCEPVDETALTGLGTTLWDMMSSEIFETD
jgi:hypothetical protein